MSTRPAAARPDGAGDAAAAAVRDAAAALGERVRELSFGAPVAFVYNPLSYAWAAHEQYILRYASAGARVVFVGMNPGPWGMAQTGVPFGEVASVREWLGIQADIGRPPREHPKRPVDGLETVRSEVSGRRLWGLFRERFTTPERFFSQHFVANYCPLLFLEESGRNRTPDRLRVTERDTLFGACDEHLRRLLAALEPEWVIGVGGFAEARIRQALGADPGVVSRPRIGRILHPSPASPHANRGWAAAAVRKLEDLGVWPLTPPGA
ncbi:MAG: uracil-DNA glycosylase family protein [Spirochaetaceae bacterium]